MRKAVLMLVFVACAGLVFAQDKPKPAPTTVGSQDLAVQALPQLTEVQSLKLQNLTLQLQMAQTQIALLQTAAKQTEAEREALLVAVEKEHSGWALNRQTGQWEKVAATVSAPKPEKK